VDFFFLKKLLVILRSLKDADSLDVCPFLFMQSSPNVPTTFGIGWFPTLALMSPDIIRLSLLLYLSAIPIRGVGVRQWLGEVQRPRREQVTRLLVD
jgi:hypothetical protein